MEFDHFEEKGYYWFKREGERPSPAKKKLCMVLKEFDIHDFNDLCSKMSAKGLAAIRLCHLPKLTLYLINAWFFYKKLVDSESLLPPNFRFIRIPSFIVTREGDNSW